MDLMIAVDSEDARDLPELFAWLREEDELRAKVHLRLHPPIPGEMGTVPDLITVAVGGGGTVSILAGALSTWLARRKSDIALTVNGRDGRMVKLNAQRVADVDRLLREVLRETRSAD